MSKLSVETIKAESRGLRGTLAEEVANGEAFFSEAGKQLLKFHGSYQQEDRDARKEDRGHKHYQFMVRTKLPGGVLTGPQYLAMDRIATDYGNNTLRITTRQDFQFHGVIKGDLRETIQAINSVFVTTIGACGDIVRNVMTCPAPTADAQRRVVQDFALELSNALLPRTPAYHQIWLNGQPLIQEELEEPLYGKTFLPRKFKIAVAFHGDNCVDIYTNDVGLVALFDNGGALIGFNVLAGGGMGLTHNNDATYARLADVVCFVEPEQVIPVVEGIVGIHRDHGDRADRKHARLKYILQERGVRWFCEDLQSRVPFALQDARPMPEFQYHDHLGWNKQGGGYWYLGIPVESGRIVEGEKHHLRSGLRAVIERFNSSVRLTPQQNILLTDIAPEHRAGIDAMLKEYRIRTVEQISAVRRNSLACPALPTCGLAITEAERALPGLLDEMENLLDELGILDESIHLRMTGCPNGCARPYVAEIAFVGRSLDKYTIYLGGNAIGTRLNEPFADLVHISELVPTLRPVLTLYRDTRQIGESFGDFCQRIGLPVLRTLIAVE